MLYWLTEFSDGGDLFNLFRYITFTFFGDVTRQTIRNLWHVKALFHWSTWCSAGRFLFGKDGFTSSNWAQWRAYLREDFHPRQQDGSRSEHWLRDNSAQFTVVGQPT